MNFQVSLCFYRLLGPEEWEFATLLVFIYKAQNSFDKVINHSFLDFFTILLHTIM